jgi:polyisoprenoid-binding protein YceI
MIRHVAVAVVSLALVAGTAASQGRGFSQNPAEAPGGTYALDKRHASVTAKVSHFGFSGYTFQVRDLDATLQYDPRNVTASKVTFTADPKSIDTGLPNFDKELASDEWVGSTPVRFVSTRLEPTGARTGRLHGDLTLKGVTKPAVFNITFNGGGPNFRGTPTLGFTAEGAIKRSDFGVSRMAGAIGEDVRLTVEAEFNKAP